MSDWLAFKESLYFYQKAIENIEGLSLSIPPEYAENNHWLNLLQIDKKNYSEDREQLMKRLEKNAIQSRPVWKLNHEQKPYNNFQSYKIDIAYKLLKKSLCLPSSSNLDNTQIALVIDCIQNKY